MIVGDMLWYGWSITQSVCWKYCTSLLWCVGPKPVSWTFAEGWWTGQRKVQTSFNEQLKLYLTISHLLHCLSTHYLMFGEVKLLCNTMGLWVPLAVTEKLAACTQNCKCRYWWSLVSLLATSDIQVWGQTHHRYIRSIWYLNCYFKPQFWV
jgi:hypothetical protein